MCRLRITVRPAATWCTIACMVGNTKVCGLQMGMVSRAHASPHPLAQGWLGSGTGRPWLLTLGCVKGD